MKKKELEIMLLEKQQLNYLIDGKTNYEIFNEVEKDFLVNDIVNALAKLRTQEAFVLICRFGLNGMQYQPFINKWQEESHRICDKLGPMILKDVAEIIGCSHERIRQIEAKALRKLRHPSRGAVLKTYCNY